ncbi:hypothetical protein Hamer_G010160, partial [Homarus americanus]
RKRTSVTWRLHDPLPELQTSSQAATAVFDFQLLLVVHHINLYVYLPKRKESAETTSRQRYELRSCWHTLGSLDPGSEATLCFKCTSDTQSDKPCRDDALIKMEKALNIWIEGPKPPARAAT